MLLAALLGAGCGGPPPPEPPDPTLARQTRTAMLAWQQDRPEQAAALFRDALRRAYARDDIAAIADIAASLAASELRLGNAEAARDAAAAAPVEPVCAHRDARSQPVYPRALGEPRTDAEADTSGAGRE
ncbi:hypothetical protein FK498_05080, partial [Elioraea sp. Yellowstone]|uniref:hypothetical protein n=1 Tax=Elioraea sp. Yellowstone TaxID=2592070 RepID=UPI001168045A